jgi:hypothetical protein
VATAPLDRTQKPIRECDGAIHFLKEGLAFVALDEVALHDTSQAALRSFANYQSYVPDELLSRHRHAYVWGPTFFGLYVQKGHCLDRSGERLAA